MQNVSHGKFKKERVSILVEEKILGEQGNKALESEKQIEFLLGKINQIRNRIQAGWKGEAGELCCERLYEIVQQTQQEGKQIEKYIKEVQQFVAKE